MGKASKVLKPKQNIGKHHKHVAAYMANEASNSVTHEVEALNSHKRK